MSTTCGTSSLAITIVAIVVWIIFGFTAYHVMQAVLFHVTNHVNVINAAE